MSNQTARHNTGVLGRLSTLGFALVFVFIASAVGAVLQPTGVVRALDEIPVEAPPTTLVFTNKPAEKTNLTNLSWQWQLTVADGDTTNYTGYTYVLKTADGTIVDQGAGDATLLSYAKNDAISGVTYTLTVTAISDSQPLPGAVLSVTSSVEVNTVPPVITDNGTTWSGNVATPGLEVTPGSQPQPQPQPQPPVAPIEPTNPVDPTNSAAPGETPSETPGEGENPPAIPPEPPVPTYTYEWTTSASPRLVTMSDPSVLNPGITFHADGQASFMVHITDAFGNFIEYLMSLSYSAPFIPGPHVPLLPEYTPLELTPVAAVVAIPKLSRSVTVDTTASSRASDSAEGALKGDATKANERTPSVDAVAKTTPIVAATPAQGWVLLGAAWYWWVLIVGIIGSAVLWWRSYSRRDS